MWWKHLRSVTSNPLLSINGSHHYPPPSRRRYCFYGHVIERMWGGLPWPEAQRPKLHPALVFLGGGAHKGRTVSKFVSCQCQLLHMRRAPCHSWIVALEKPGGAGRRPPSLSGVMWSSASSVRVVSESSISNYLFISPPRIRTEFPM